MIIHSLAKDVSEGCAHIFKKMSDKHHFIFYILEKNYRILKFWDWWKESFNMMALQLEQYGSADLAPFSDYYILLWKFYSFYKINYEKENDIISTVFSLPPVQAFYRTLCLKKLCTSLFNWTVAEFEEFERRFKFKPRLKYGWFHLKLYQMFQDLSRR